MLFFHAFFNAFSMLFSMFFSMLFSMLFFRTLRSRKVEASGQQQAPGLQVPAAQLRQADEEVQEEEGAVHLQVKHMYVQVAPGLPDGLFSNQKYKFG
jgi:hypothetical protein